MNTKTWNYVYTNKWVNDNNCVCDCTEGRHMVVHPVNVCATNGFPSINIMCDCQLWSYSRSCLQGHRP